MEQGREKVREAKGQASEKVQDLKEKGREAIHNAKDELKDQVDRRTTRTADRLEAVVDALQTAADQLGEKGERRFADYAHQAAGQVQRVSRYMRDEDAPAMISDLEAMARTNPGTFLGTAFASGVALGRFLRASQPHDQDDRGNGAQRSADGAGHETEAGTVTGGLQNQPSGAGASGDRAYGAGASVGPSGTGASAPYGPGGTAEDRRNGDGTTPDRLDSVGRPYHWRSDDTAEGSR